MQFPKTRFSPEKYNFPNLLKTSTSKLLYDYAVLSFLGLILNLMDEEIGSSYFFENYWFSKITKLPINKLRFLNSSQLNIEFSMLIFHIFCNKFQKMMNQFFHSTVPKIVCDPAAHNLTEVWSPKNVRWIHKNKLFS